MCFIKKKRTDKLKIAKKDIVCYKVSIRSTSCGVPNDFTKFNPYYCWGFTYKQEKQATVIKLGTRNIEVNKGYHSYKNRRHLMNYWNGCDLYVGIFIIPKGAKYYENDQEYVSSTLIFKRYTKPC